MQYYQFCTAFLSLFRDLSRYDIAWLHPTCFHLIFISLQYNVWCWVPVRLLILWPKSMYCFCEENVHTFECVAKEYARSGTYFDDVMQREQKRGCLVMQTTVDNIPFILITYVQYNFIYYPHLFFLIVYFTIHFTMCSTKLRSEAERHRRTKRRLFVRRLFLTFMCNVCNESYLF